MKHPEYQYLDLLKDIIKNGEKKPVWGNPGVFIKGVFGRQIRFDLSKGFPLLTTKKVFMRGITHELIWFLRGDSNIKYLVDNDVHIWDEWGYKRFGESQLKIKNEKLRVKLTQEQYLEKIRTDNEFAKKYGDLGPVYGVQWRRWPAFVPQDAGLRRGKPSDENRSIDQLGWVINKLKDPKQRFRKHLIVSAWNPAYIYEMAPSREDSVALPPCHTMFHFNVLGNRLNLQLYQRSADIFLGVPFNIASYSLLLIMVSQIVGIPPGDFVHTFGDVHTYSNHQDQIKEQLKRKPRPFPKVKLNPNVKSIDDFKFEDIEIIDYDPYPPIKGEVTVVGGF
ncbi:MAG: thymidylate synthase [Candidatus Roizmanbacteria bacterium]|nr:thymidylate synthase [Candidatus Roizmanbacteria bacterium]MCR4313189.1 thymidylate synthase [Candidatus Roizmanbacteria bacterium]